MKRTRTIFYLVTLLLTAACINQQAPQVASNDDEDFGIGGTGIMAENFGIGGTGIIGEVTGFGSIFVNGIEIESSEDTRISMNGVPTETHRFQVGEVVEVLTRDERDYTRAQRINIRHEIIGPVAAVHNSQRSLTILGQAVHLQRLPGWTLQAGDFVAISGYRDRSGAIQATHVSPRGSTEILLRGTIRSGDEGYSLLGWPLQFATETSVQPGNRTLTGHLLNGQVRITRIADNRLLPFDDVRRWRIQGYAVDYAPLFGLARAAANDNRGIFDVHINAAGEARMQQIPAQDLNRGSSMRLVPGRMNPGRSPMHRQQGINSSRGRWR